MKLTSTPLKISTLTLFLLLGSWTLSGQQEANNWYFGNRAGITFSTGTATPLAGSVMNTTEGCTTLSDEDGDLLFYSDGSTVWDASHNPMANGTGLGGNSSSTQSGVAIPSPANPNEYYMFSASAQTAAGGIQYCVIDMTLNGGLGDVTIKNQSLLDPACEKITAINHCNGRDIWVIAHGWESDSFFAWLVTPAGINPPVISSLGYIPTANTAETIGYMKASSDGSKLGLTIYTAGIFELYDFNDVTGELTNVRTMNMSATHTSLYGFEFSANGRYCYVAAFGGGVYQFDTEAGNAAQILATQQMISPGTFNYGAIQIGPDDNLYVTKFGTGVLDMIAGADQQFPGVSYQDSAVILGANMTALGGLPNFTRISKTIAYSGHCEQEPFEFFATSGCADSIRWWFDDPASGENNTMLADTGVHHFTDGGQYSVLQIVYYATYTDSLVIEVDVEYEPDFTLGPDLEICPDETLTLQPSVAGTTYLWSTGETTSTKDITGPGEYWLALTHNGCTFLDTLEATPLFYPTPPDLGEDITLCPGGVITLQPQTFGHDITWHDGSKNSTYTSTRPEIISLTLGNECGTETDDVELSYEQCSCNIWVPTALTAEGNGHNDVLELTADCEIDRNFELLIFNRWGQLIYQTRTFTDHWDPNIDLPLGVYVYRLTYFDNIQEVDIQKSGNITVIR